MSEEGRSLDIGILPEEAQSVENVVVARAGDGLDDVDLNNLANYLWIQKIESRNVENVLGISSV